MKKWIQYNWLFKQSSRDISILHFFNVLLNLIIIDLYKLSQKIDTDKLIQKY